MKRLLSTSIVRPVAALALTAGLCGGALAGTAAAATPAHPATAHPATAHPATPAPATTPSHLVAVPAGPAKPAGHSTSRLACPGIDFTVLHNDRSGGLVLPAGRYRVWSPTLSCKVVSNDFTTFLNHYQGAIPGWTGKQLGWGYGTYTQNRSHVSFAVQY